MPKVRKLLPSGREKWKTLCLKLLGKSGAQYFTRIRGGSSLGKETDMALPRDHPKALSMNIKVALHLLISWII